MKKSVYSLVLEDYVVDAIDSLAYRNGTSRSNLINQILAEHISYLTPQKRMRNIFDYMEQLFDNRDDFIFLTQPSDAMISIKSALKYKYKPTIKYAVELYDEEKELIGELKVLFRTTSKQLIDDLTRFFILWAKLENQYIAKYFPGGKIEYTISDGKLTRSILNPQKFGEMSEEEIGAAISEYIKSFDNILKIYFDNIAYLPAADEAAMNAYINNIKHKKIIV